MGLVRARLSQRGIRASDTGPTASSGSARVAVIVPVFNAMPYLGELLDSLAAQDLDPEHFELILVDDGSTDGGPQLMDRFAAAHPGTRVIRQRNSGWPGQPRNRGLAATEADYVFFADAGDMLASHALRSMLDYAQLHQADMVLPRIAGLNGRPVNRTLLAKNNPKAELREVFATLAPQKLIRRALIERLELRFPEGRVRLEDGIFITACYLAAERTAVLADDDYYFLRARQDANNISARKADPEGCTRSVARIAEQVRAARLPADLEQGMVLDLYRRKILRTYRPGRWLGMGRWRRRSWLRAHAGFVARFIPAQLESQLGFPHRQRSAALRTGDARQMQAWALLEQLLAAHWNVRQDRQGGQAAGVPHFVPAGPPPQLAELILRPRHGGADAALPLRPAADAFALHGGQELQPSAPDIYDVYVQASHRQVQGEPRRVRVGRRDWAGHRFYATVNGYLSLDARPRDGQAVA